MYDSYKLLTMLHLFWTETLPVSFSAKSALSKMANFSFMRFPENLLHLPSVPLDCIGLAVISLRPEFSIAQPLLLKFILLYTVNLRWFLKVGFGMLSLPWFHSLHLCDVIQSWMGWDGMQWVHLHYSLKGPVLSSIAVPATMQARD